MATNKHAIIRYEALDRCFSNPGRKFYIEDLIGYTSDTLGEYTGEATSISRRQIFNDINFMRSEAGFRAPIESFKEGRKTYYRYTDRNYSLAIQQINPIEADLLRTTLEMLKMSLKLKKSFQLEDLDHTIYFDENEYLKNIHLLGDLIKHIQNKTVLNIHYQPFSQTHHESFIFHPYFLKQYNKRWFVFGQRPEFESWTSLALDRIITFQPKDSEAHLPMAQDPDTYFEDVIGVSKPPNTSSLHVKIRIDQYLWPYIESKPIHPSQKVVERKSDSVIIQLDIIPNYEFYAQILGFGAAVEIIAPTVVREELYKKIEQNKANFIKHI